MKHTCGYPCAVAEGVAGVAGVAGARGVVVVGATGGMGATHPGAWVHTLGPHTGLVIRTLRVDGALRLAGSVRVTKHLRQALAGGRPVPVIADSIDATGRRVAGVNDLRSCRGCGNSIASIEGISLVSLVADTNGHMVPDPAVGIDATEARAGILALSGDASKFLGAVGVDNTLRSAVRRRSDHFSHACAATIPPIISGRQAVWTTRIGITGVFLNHRLNGCKMVLKLKTKKY